MITGFVGGLGGGKTLTAVRIAVREAERSDCLLVSNIRINPPGSVRFVQLTMDADWPDQLAEIVMRVVLGAYSIDERPVRGVIFVLDEAGLMLGARTWRDMPFELIWLLAQSRHVRLDLLWTAQFEDMVDAILREITAEVWHCATWPRIGVRGREKGRRPVFVRVRRYRQGTVGQENKVIGTSWLRYRRMWEGWYDTDEVVWPARLRERVAALRGVAAVADAVEQ